MYAVMGSLQSRPGAVCTFVGVDVYKRQVLLFPELSHDLIAGALLEFSAQADGRHPADVQLVTEAGSSVFGVAEHQHLVVTIAGDDLAQIFNLLAAGVGLQAVLGCLLYTSRCV